MLVQAQIHLIRPIPSATSTFLSTPVALDPRGPHVVLNGVLHGMTDQNVANVIAPAGGFALLRISRAF
jgi:hypothetical protein